jgi:hypothetical protein
MLFRFVLCLICFFVWSNCSQALDESEHSLFPLISLNPKKLAEALESLDQQIKNDSSTNFELMDLLIERGTILFFSGEHEAAINDFAFALMHSNEIPEPSRREKISEALWGRMWGYAFLGKQKEFFEDLHSISKLLSECYHTSAKISPTTFQSDLSPATPCKSKKNIKDDDWEDVPQNYDSDENVSFCIDTVNNTISFMKGMCNAIRDQGIKTSLYLFIEGLGRQAIRCCTARGFWRTCVDPMVQKMNRWKIFGIPADPYWDND